MFWTLDLCLNPGERQFALALGRRRNAWPVIATAHERDAYIVEIVYGREVIARHERGRNGLSPLEWATMGTTNAQNLIGVNKPGRGYHWRRYPQSIPRLGMLFLLL